MKIPSFLTQLCVILLLFLVSSCGYRNPYVYTGPEKTIYIAEWKNRTSELGLDAEIYRSLARWFQKSGSLHVTKEKEGADLILAGEIVSLSLPTQSYTRTREAAQVKIRMRVRYILKDIATGKVLIQEPNQMMRESYLNSSNTVTAQENERVAMEQIIKDLSQKIYQRTIVQIPRI